jgi:hypothetical protein
VAAADDLHLIVVEDPSPNLREGIHQVVKLHADVWWHEMPDVWVVGGGSPDEWRKRLEPLKTAAAENTMVLVVQLPGPGDVRVWSAHGPDAQARFAWFHEHYTPNGEPDDDIPF